MAEIEKKEDEGKSGGGGGNKNAIAYGLLQRAGVNTNGMSPSDAWAMVSQLNLMESKRWKRTDADKKEIRQKNDNLKQQGQDKISVLGKAKRFSSAINFSEVSNVAAVNEAVDAVADVFKSYKIDKLQNFRAANLSNGTLASANGETLNVGRRLLRNPGAAFRICSEQYKEHNKREIAELTEFVQGAKDDFTRQKYQQALDKAQRGAKFDRHNVIYKGEEVRSVVMHESGHVLAGQIFGFCEGGTGQHTQGANKKIYDCFQESKANGDIYKISAYADTSADEFFAECFCMKQMGKEKLPPRIDKMMEDVLGIWKK